MALELTPDGLQRLKIPIMKGVNVGLLYSEKVDHSKMKAEGSRARSREVIRNLTCGLQDRISQKTSL